MLNYQRVYSWQVHQSFNSYVFFSTNDQTAESNSAHLSKVCVLVQKLDPKLQKKRPSRSSCKCLFDGII
jgi:hypothetical protein